jgi:tetraacyldisaccharide 4'-kinase
VFVGRSRYQAAQTLLARYPDTELIVCDDGLQHFSLYRDLEICVFDDRGCGNGWLLPSGPLRETWPRRPLQQAGQRNDRLLVLHTGEQPHFSGFRAQRSLAQHALRSNGETVALDTLQQPGMRPLLAVAAIAQPAAFFRMLEHSGLVIAKTLPLPDHYDFDSFLRNEHGGYQLICTEKDATKLWQKAPDALAIPLTQTMEPAFWTELDRQIAGLSPTKLSSPHGHKTS